MKFKYIISISLAVILSLGSLMWVNQTEGKELNTDFKIETIAGDEDILRNFELSAITKSNQNKFSKVIFDGEKFSIEETIYDERYQLDGDQLANRELYRHMYYPTKFETDNYMITTEFDYSYTFSNTDPSARIAVKNKETGEIHTENPVFQEISRSEWVMDVYVTENEGNLYYILTTENARVIIYLFNPDTLEFQYEFEHQFDGESFGNFATANQFLYFIPYVDGTSDEIDVHSLNLATREAEKQVVPFDRDSWISGIFGGGNHILLETDTGFYLYDENKGSLIELEAPSFMETVNSTDGFSYFWSNHSIEGNYAIINYESENESGLNRQQFIAIYDLEAQKIIYEGQISLRNDQGLVTSFSVSLAQ